MTTAGPTYFDTSDQESVQRWEKKLFVTVARDTPIFNAKNGFVREDADGLIQRKTELFKNGGAKAWFTLVREFRGKPSFGNETLRGKEQGLRTATNSLEITKVRAAAGIDGEIVQQAIEWSVADQNQKELAAQFRKFLEAGAMMHLTGFTIDANAAGTRIDEWYFDGTHKGLCFGQLPTAPDAKHMYRCGGLSTDQAVGADPTAFVDLNVIEDLIARAKLLPTPIRKARIGGMKKYVFFLHPDVTKLLRRQESEWWQLMTAAMQGGKIEGNPLWGGEGTKILGEYQDTVFIETAYLPPGIHSTASTAVANTRRCVFAGAQALLLGLGRRYANENMFRFEKENWDYNDKAGIAAGMLAGMKATRFNIEEAAEDQDYGKIVVTSYAADSITWS